MLTVDLAPHRRIAQWVVLQVHTYPLPGPPELDALGAPVERGLLAVDRARLRPGPLGPSGALDGQLRKTRQGDAPAGELNDNDGPGARPSQKIACRAALAERLRGLLLDADEQRRRRCRCRNARRLGGVNHPPRLTPRRGARRSMRDVR